MHREEENDSDLSESWLSDASHEEDDTVKSA